VIKKLSKVQRNSFWVYDISDVIQRIQIWRHLMPRVELFYAAKTNPDLAIVK
jgi:diaminopimelate decarboxylase